MHNSAADPKLNAVHKSIADPDGAITTVCMYCNKIRGASMAWHITDEANLDPATHNLSHTACPACFSTALRLLEEELRGAVSWQATA